jgi:hypothetical protein
MVAMLVLEASVERRASSSLAPGTILNHIAQVFADCTVQHNSVVCFNMVDQKDSFCYYTDSGYRFPENGVWRR